MRWALVLLALLACSAVGSFKPAECRSLSPDSRGALHDRLYRDLMRGTYDSSDCFKFGGRVVESVQSEGGYRVDTEGWGTSYPGDVFVRWEGDYRFVQGDLVVVTGAVADPLTYETTNGAIRTIPAFYGSSMLDMEQHSRQVSATREAIEAQETATREAIEAQETATREAIEAQETATREAIEAMKQAEYRADYEQRTFDALQMVSSCESASDVIIRTVHKANAYTHQLRDLTLKFSIGPDPDRIDPDTVPHILLEGYYKMEPRQSSSSWKHGQVNAVWTGEGCGFKDIIIKEAASPPVTPTPTKDPNAPKPTYTPRPIPTRR